MPDNTFRCPNCKKKISEIDKFCPHCGEKIGTGKKTFKTISKNSIIFIFALTIIILATLWITGFIPICGDSYCVAKECSSGCTDCSPDKCQDNICQPQVGENCKNSNDCVCDINQECDPSYENSNSKGCYEIICNDKRCDSKKENQQNCCLDCGCPQGYTCSKEKNECQFQIPEISIETYSVLQGVSASTLYSNNRLKDDLGKEHPFASITMKNTGSNIAKNVKLKISMGSYLQEELLPLGSIEAGSTKTFDWYPTAKDTILSIKDAMSLLVSVEITFEDEYSKTYRSVRSFPVSIVGRSNMGMYSSHSQFITPQDSVIRQAVSAAGSFSTSDTEGIHKAASSIWNFLNGLGIDYISDPAKEYRQYPAEVLQTKRGDCDDLATLYAALLESIGIKTALIIEPGHMYMGYFAGNYIYPVETTLWGSTFDSANKEGTEQYNADTDRVVIKTQDEWKKKNIKVPAYIGVDSVDLKFPIINVHVGQSADWNLIDPLTPIYRLSITCDVEFVNSGTASGQKCVNVMTYLDDMLVKTENVCKKVNADSHAKETVVYTQDSGSSFAFKYRCEIR